jgi:diguanylate cyclase (GGDEF)-like protein
LLQPLLLALALAAPAATAPPDELEAELERCWTTAVDDPAKALVRVESELARPEASAASGPAASAFAELGLCRGYIHEQLGDTAAAGADYQLAVERAQKLGDRKLLASALSQRGELAYYRGDFTAALDDLDHAYRIELEVGRRSRQLYVLNAIANVYADARVGAYDRAIEYYRQTLAAHVAAGHQADIATGHFNLGSTYERKGDLAAAISEYGQAAALDRQRGDPDEVAFDERALAAALARGGRPREALPLVERAIARFRANGDAELLAQALLTRGVARRALGDPRAALADLDAAGAHFGETKNDRYRVRVEGERAAALAALGDFGAAFAARSSELELERRLAERSRDEHTSRLRVQFDAEKKEQENRALARENALREQALRDAERIRSLQRWVLALTAVLAAGLAALAARQIARARRLHRLAMTDELTRLPNRRSLLALAEERLAAARSTGRALSLVGFDVDHFKKINDTHGHDVGDRVLQRVAQAARSALRQTDAVGRTGGEEFLAVLPGSDARVAAEIAERLRAAIERLDLGDAAPGLRATVSVGVASRRDDDDLAALARRADEALYLAKRSGRNRVETWSDSEA